MEMYWQEKSQEIEIREISRFRGDGVEVSDKDDKPWKIYLLKMRDFAGFRRFRGGGGKFSKKDDYSWRTYPLENAGFRRIPEISRRRR